MSAVPWICWILIGRSGPKDGNRETLHRFVFLKHQRAGDRLIILPRLGRQIAGGIINRDRSQVPIVASQDRHGNLPIPPGTLIAFQFEAHSRIIVQN